MLLAFSTSTNRERKEETEGCDAKAAEKAREQEQGKQGRAEAN